MMCAVVAATGFFTFEVNAMSSRAGDASGVGREPGLGFDHRGIPTFSMILTQDQQHVSIRYGNEGLVVSLNALGALPDFGQYLKLTQEDINQGAPGLSVTELFNSKLQNFASRLLSRHEDVRAYAQELHRLAPEIFTQEGNLVLLKVRDEAADVAPAPAVALPTQKAGRLRLDERSTGQLDLFFDGELLRENVVPLLRGQAGFTSLSNFLRLSRTNAPEADIVGRWVSDVNSGLDAALLLLQAVAPEAVREKQGDGSNPPVVDSGDGQGGSKQPSLELVPPSHMPLGNWGKAARAGTGFLHAAILANLIAELAGDRNMILDALKLNKELRNNEKFKRFLGKQDKSIKKSKSAHAARIMISVVQALALAGGTELLYRKWMRPAAAR